MTYLHISKWYMYTVLGALSCKHYWLLPWLRYSYFTLFPSSPTHPPNTIFVNFESKFAKFYLLISMYIIMCALDVFYLSLQIFASLTLPSPYPPASLTLPSPYPPASLTLPSCFPHPTLLLKKAVRTTSAGFLWPLGSVGLASGICSRRWERVKEGVRSGYFFPWVLPFKVSSGQMCSSARSHWTSWWPAPHDSFQFPLTSPSPCFFGPRGDGIC